MNSLEKLAWFQEPVQQQPSSLDMFNDQQLKMWNHYQKNKRELDNYSALPWVARGAVGIPTFAGAYKLFRKAIPHLSRGKAGIFSAIIATGAALLGSRAVNHATGRSKMMKENRRLRKYMKDGSSYTQFAKQYNDSVNMGAQWNPINNGTDAYENQRYNPNNTYTPTW